MVDVASHVATNKTVFTAGESNLAGPVVIETLVPSVSPSSHISQALRQTMSIFSTIGWMGCKQEGGGGARTNLPREEINSNEN